MADKAKKSVIQLKEEQVEDYLAANLARAEKIRA